MWACFFISFILFVLLTPGILLRLPPNGGKLTVAVVHGVVLVFLLRLIMGYYKKNYEGLMGGGYGSVGRALLM